MPELYKRKEFDAKFQHVFQDEVRSIIDSGKQFLICSFVDTMRICRNREQVDDCIATTGCRRWYIAPKHLFSKEKQK